MEVEQLQENVMKKVRVGKVVINMAVGKSGERLDKAAKILEIIAGQRPSQRKAKKTIRNFGIYKGEPIAVIATIRKQKALETLKLLLQAKGNVIKRESFDELGNVSFGIKEHIDIPGMKYDPEIGIFGMDVSVQLERPGYRVARRRRARSKVGRAHLVRREDAIEFFKNELGVEVR
jgi:large subunit ribosomal protein L5